MAAWLTAAHIASIVIWCGGLIALPGLFACRPAVESPGQLYRLQRFVRYAYVQAISPAAFMAVATGLLLIFAREAFTPWMALKLLAVGLLVLLHLRAGHVIQRLFEPGRSYARWRQPASVVAVLAAAGAILWLVLAKPVLDLGRLPDWLRSPGGLQDLLDTMIPIP